MVSQGVYIIQNTNVVGGGVAAVDKKLLKENRVQEKEIKDRREKE